jgi:hypothetical protein
LLWGIAPLIEYPAHQLMVRVDWRLDLWRQPISDCSPVIGHATPWFHPFDDVFGLLKKMFNANATKLAQSGSEATDNSTCNTTANSP